MYMHFNKKGGRVKLTYAETTVWANSELHNIRMWAAGRARVLLL